MRILVCPLNWGLGHATRCVPIIKRLIADGNEVILVSDGFPLRVLQQEFPQLRYIYYPSYLIRYSKGKSQVGAMLRCSPRIIRRIIQEHRWLRKTVETEKIDMVISDNRFGLWCKCVKSVYITHQLMIKMPQGLKFVEPLAWLVHRFFINRYDECWIPDNEDFPNLSGDLAHKYLLPKNARFIGSLSRFDDLKSTTPNTEFEIVAVLSGVEPQRSIFENQLIEQFHLSNQKVLIVRGEPKMKKEVESIGQIALVSHLETEELASVILGAKKIICRSGYSTIMDLEALDCLHKAEFIPTPGQTEQEYLAKYHSAL